MCFSSVNFNSAQNCMPYSQLDNKILDRIGNSPQEITRFGAVWLPVPTILGIINAIFWTWLILKTVGYEEKRQEKIIAPIINQF